MIAYLSHDQVNRTLVRRMARRLGLDLVVLSLKEADQAVAADLLVLDLDSLPSDTRSKLFLRVGNGELRSGVAVHSYHLTSSEARTLQVAGVRVTRRLTAAVFVVRKLAVA
ncbi:MAG: hypothetical protein C0467_30140 [Planctomycetaceae bacterium]|nr:hypothetical protein [Planctomycetaceae bacterium]